MSLWKTIQHQPRVISLFTHDLELNKNAQLVFQFLSSNQVANTKSEFNYNVELHSRFPTFDQLRYMYGMNAFTVSSEMPKVESVLKKDRFNKIFGSELSDCIKNGFWKDKSTIWVDWERRSLGNSVESIQKHLQDK